jgi:drug/metabolite transporter (DMT)-like permease
MANRSIVDKDCLPPAQTKRTSGRRVALLGYGACALAGCLWGTGFYWGRIALNEMSVEHMVLYRFLFASLGMLPIVAGQPRPVSSHPS